MEIRGVDIQFGYGTSSAMSFIADLPPLGNKAIFGYGFISPSPYYAITNLVSNTGVVAANTTGVGTARQFLAAAGYGGNKAIFGYGQGNSPPYSYLSMTNLVSNTGVVAEDTSGVGTARSQLAAASFSS